MLQNGSFVGVKLNETDVPGAKLIYADLRQHSVTQLRRWLECRGLPTSGNKAELAERSVSFACDFASLVYFDIIKIALYSCVLCVVLLVLQCSRIF